MRNQYKLLAEKYDQVLEADQKPALKVHPDGTKEWYQNGRQHRSDGPAVEHPDGTKEWYINGIELTEDEFNKWKWKHDQHEALKKASAETGIEMDI